MVCMNKIQGATNTKITNIDFQNKLFLFFDISLIVLIIPVLISYFLPSQWQIPYALNIIAVLSILGVVPVIVSAIKSLLKKKLSVDLLATIALFFSFISREWISAGFITLMLAFARVFDHLTEARAKKTIQSLMKYNVERVRIKTSDDSIREVHINEVKAGDLVIVEDGDRMPVDGIVVSGAVSYTHLTLPTNREV